MSPLKEINLGISFVIDSQRKLKVTMNKDKKIFEEKGDQYVSLISRYFQYRYHKTTVQEAVVSEGPPTSSYISRSLDSLICFFFYSHE